MGKTKLCIQVNQYGGNGHYGYWSNEVHGDNKGNVTFINLPQEWNMGLDLAKEETPSPKFKVGDYVYCDKYNYDVRRDLNYNTILYPTFKVAEVSVQDEGRTYLRPVYNKPTGVIQKVLTLSTPISMEKR